MLNLLFSQDLIVIFLFPLARLLSLPLPPIDALEALLLDFEHVKIICDITHSRCILQIGDDSINKWILLDDVIVKFVPQIIKYAIFNAANLITDADNKLI